MELEMIRNLYNSYNKERADLRSRHLDEKRHVKWCCRCSSPTDFSQEKRIEPFCQHERDHDCLKFDGGRQTQATTLQQEIQEPPSCVIRNSGTVDPEP